MFTHAEYHAAYPLPCGTIFDFIPAIYDSHLPAPAPEPAKVEIEAKRKLRGAGVTSVYVTRYVSVLSKDNWMTSRQIADALGLKKTNSVTQMMSGAKMKEFTKREQRMKKGVIYLVWRLK